MFIIFVIGVKVFDVGDVEVVYVMVLCFCKCNYGFVWKLCVDVARVMLMDDIKRVVKGFLLVFVLVYVD